MDRVVTNLSGGELQRLALVLALGTPADIYLIVEHDFIMATYLADKVIVYTGSPARDCRAQTPQSLLDGMNEFLKNIEVTFRRDPTNYRPRINKLDSQKDTEQKNQGNYFFLDADD